MAKRIIDLEVKDIYIKGAGVILGAAAAHNNVTLHVKFDKSWVGCNICAYFNNALANNPIAVLLSVAETLEYSDGECEVHNISVPLGVLEHEGKVTLSFFGYTVAAVEVDGTIEYQETSVITSATAYFNVLQSDTVLADDLFRSATVTEQLLAAHNELNEMFRVATDISANEEARIAAEEAREIAEEARKSAESSRQEAESSRQATFEASESSRQATFEASESVRADNEYWRGVNETFREQQESERVSKENLRQQNENVRESNESSRIMNDEARQEVIDGLEAQIEELRALIESGGGGGGSGSGEAYPVGSIYISVNADTSPAELFGGTWEQLSSGTFLRSVTSNYGATGGSNFHTHSCNGLNASITFGSYPPDTSKYYLDMEKSTNFNRGGWGDYGIIIDSENHDTKLTSYNYSSYPRDMYGVKVYGTSKNGSSLPPYLDVAMWKRIA